MSKTVSNKGLQMIKQFEGLRIKAYQCQAGVWTIGYGHTKGVKAGTSCSKEQAERYLKEDLKIFEKVINNNVKVELTQSMFDALVSLSFNIGATAFKNSTLLKYLNDKDYNNASEQFLVWNKITVNGSKQVSQGLVNRRKKEKAFFEAEEFYSKKDTATIKVGDKIYIKKGAKDLNMNSTFSSFVYTGKYEVIEVSRSRVVFGLNGKVTGVVAPVNVTKA